MPNSDELFDGFLDALALGQSIEVPELDAQSAEAARGLFLRASVISPSQEFVNRLESKLVQTGPAPNFRRASPPPRGVRHVRTGRGWAGHAFGALALAVIAIVTMAVIYRTGPDEPIFAVASVAASPASFPAATDCDHDPVPDSAGRAALRSTYGPALLITIEKMWRPAPDAPHASVAIIPNSKLPAGAKPDAAIQSAIETAVRREIACRNFGLFGWSGTSSSMIENSTPQTGNLATPASVDANSTPLPVPASLVMTELADGRVGVELPADLEGSGLAAYAIYAPYRGDWFMTEYARTASDAWLLSH